MLVNVNVVVAPTGCPSTKTLAMWKPAFGVIVKAWLLPKLTLTSPFGLIEPPGPAEAVIMKVLMSKVAVIVCGVITFVNV